MASDVDIVYNKVIVDNFFLISCRDPNYYSEFSNFEFLFLFFQMTFAIDVVYNKVVALNMIHNFVVDKFFIWDCLEDQNFVFFNQRTKALSFENSKKLIFKLW
jgi:hypothetical protein